MEIRIAEAREPEPSITLLATIPVGTDDGRRLAGLVIDQLCSVGSRLAEQGRGCTITWEMVPGTKPVLAGDDAERLDLDLMPESTLAADAE